MTQPNIENIKKAARILGCTTRELDASLKRTTKKEPAICIGSHMARSEIATALDAMVFTAARNWERKVVMDKIVRDLFVSLLRAPVQWK